MAIAVRKIKHEVVDLGRAFDLHWVDPAVYDDAGSPADYERKRRFKHCGGAIAWARRQLFHGKVYGESIEMRTIEFRAFEGKVSEEEIAVVDITLAGFRKWEDGYSTSLSGAGVTLSKPERKCRASR